MSLGQDPDELRRIVTAGDGLWRLDLPTGRMDSDETSWRALGYDTPAGRPPWASLLHAEDEQLAWKAVSEGVARGTLPPFVVRLRRRDGTYQRVLGRGVVTERGPDGAPLALSGFHTFLEPLGLVQPRDAQSDLLTALPDVIAVLYRDCTLSTVHQGGAPGLRAVLEARQGAKLDELLAPESGAALRKETARVLAGLAPAPLEVDWSFDGRPHRVELRLSRLTEVTALVLVRDVTDTTSTAALLARISAAVPGLVYLYCRWPDGRDAFLYMNAQSQNILGVPAARIWAEARTAWENVLPEDVRLLREALERSRRDGSAFAPTFRVRVEGQLRWLRAQAMPSRPDPEGATTWAGVIIDVTAEIQAEEERRRLAEGAARGERLEQLGLMAGGIAHDFNNLLVGVFGSAAQLVEELGAGHPAATLARDIEHAARQMADITRQMLNFSGRNPAPARPVDLSRAVRDALPLVQASAGGSARIELQLGRDGLSVAVDPGQITQLLANLVMNAADAIGPGRGTIWLETGAAELTAEELRRTVWGGPLRPGPCVFLEVRDDGPGIAPAVRERLFEPFVTTKDPGRGLGLAVVGGIVRSCGGAALVDSAPGRGTRIRLLFPPAGLPPAAARAPAQAAAAGGGVTVLVVDDEPFVRSVAKRILERAGHRVILAEDGEMALALARDAPLALALVDATMPGMSGADVLKALASLRPGLPLVLMSGYARDEVRDAAASAAAGFVAKPFSPDDLREAVSRALGTPKSERN